MGLKEEFLRVLHTGEVRRIHFSFKATDNTLVTVNSHSFRRVVRAIENNEIHFQASTPQHPIPANAMKYRINNNTTFVGRINHQSRIFDALVVHEMVHASLDLTHSVLPHVDSEAAGYIAQGFYLRNSNFDQNLLSQGGIEQEVLFGFLISQHVAHSGTVPQPSLDELRESLFHNPSYQSIIHGMFVGNG